MKPTRRQLTAMLTSRRDDLEAHARDAILRTKPHDMLDYWEMLKQELGSDNDHVRLKASFAMLGLYFALTSALETKPDYFERERKL